MSDVLDTIKAANPVRGDRPGRSVNALMAGWPDARNGRMVGRRPRRTGRFALAGATLAAAVLAIAFTSTGERAAPAFAGPAILQRAGAPVPPALQRKPGSLLASMGIGPRRFDRAIAVASSRGHTDYLLVGDTGACLSVADPAADDPERERAMNCATNAALKRFGIAGGLTDHLVVAVPPHVRPPLVKHADGSSTTLTPANTGLVSVDLRPGDRLIRFARDGTRRAGTD